VAERLMIVTDSTADLPARVIKDHDITVVPLNVHFGEEVLKDGEEIWAEEFYHRMHNEAVLPNTSQPSPAEFARVYEILAAKTDHILSIHISEKLSGTIGAASLAAEMVRDKVKVTVIDSNVVCMGLGLVVYTAAKAVAQGVGRTDVLAEIERAKREVGVYFTVESLAHLNRTGRIGKASALIGSLLNIRPILGFDQGVIVPVEKFRGSSSKANVRLLEILAEAMRGRPCYTALVHADLPDEAARLQEIIPTMFKSEEQFTSIVGPIVGVHAGPGAIGVMAVPVS